MLDAYIIEELRRRERQGEDTRIQPSLELPLPEPRRREDVEKPSRGVVEIPFYDEEQRNPFEVDFVIENYTF